MSLQLDARQRAILAEMGIRVFEPLRPEPVVIEAAPASTRVAPPAARPTQPASAAATAPPAVLAAIESMDWEALADAVVSRRICPSCSAQATPVFGTGDSRAQWLIVGDPPDEDEEAQGQPFVGDAGALMDNMLKALGLDRRSKVFLTNIIKCRLPGSRNPSPEELAQCEPILRRQVELLQPKVILVMGRFAVPALLGTSEPIGKLRGRPHQYRGIPVVATYHPGYLLRNLRDKAKAWADLCLAQQLVRSRQG